MNLKKLMLYACRVIIAFTFPGAYAQTQGVSVITPGETDYTVYHDTLIIKPGNESTIYIIGDKLSAMKNYTQADSIKTLFINDVTTARNTGALSGDAQKVFYFVHQSGKRRIKAEQAEYTERSIDPNYEIMRMDNNLQKYEYFIYDMVNHYQINVYLSNPDSLMHVLSGISLAEAIREAGKQEKSVLRRSYRMEFEYSNNNYQLKSSRHGRYDMIELGPSFGVGLTGNTFSPVIGIDLWLRLTNKYTVHKFKAGASWNALAFVNSTAGEISGVSFVRSYELKVAYNFSENKTSTVNWVGFKGGLIKSELNTFNNAYKFGFISGGSGGFTYSFDYIRDRNKNPVYGLTIMRAF